MFQLPNLHLHDLPLLFSLALLLFLAVRYLYRHLRFQAKLRNIPGPETSYWGGTFTYLYDTVKGWEFFELIQEKYTSVCRLTTPIGCNDMLYLNDPLAMLQVVRKDEHLYDDPVDIHLMLQMVLGNSGLSATVGAKHQRQRKILQPLFTASSLRNLSPVFYEITGRFLDSLQKLCTEEVTELDLALWGSRVSLEMIGRGAVGYSFDTLAIGEEASVYGAKMKKTTATMSKPLARLGMKYLIPMFASLKTPGFNRFILNLIPSAAVRDLKKFINDLDRITKDLFAMKKSTLLKSDGKYSVGNGEVEKDLIGTLISNNVLPDTPDKINEDEAISHFRTLVYAATDSSSSSLLRTFSLLAENPRIQERLRDEVLNAKKDPDFSFDQLQNLPFLEAVYREMLRLYPPAPYFYRLALTDTIVPLAYPITGNDGKKINEIMVPKGTVLTMSALGVNRNAAIWGSDAAEWKPDRWLKPLPETVKDSRVGGIYSNLLTFGDGKRACLGYRYIQMEWKIVVSELLCGFRLEPPADPEKISWKLGIVLTATVDGNFSLPLRVSRI